MTADRERGLPARDVTWTSNQPPPARHRPEDIMRRDRALSQVKCYRYCQGWILDLGRGRVSPFGYFGFASKIAKTKQNNIKFS